MKFISLFLCILVITVPFSIVSAIPSYSSEQVWNNIHSNDQALIIDVRPYSAYVEGHIPTAINLPLAARINENTVNTIKYYNRSEVITYCSCPDGISAENYNKELITNYNLTNIYIYYMHEDFRYWPYDITTGSEPGIISINSEELSNYHQNQNNDSMDPSVVPLLIINVILFGTITFFMVKRSRTK